MSESLVRLAQHSHGVGYGCEVSPKALETILRSEQAKFVDPNLLVGGETRSDAMVYDLDNGTSVISTTDFFMSAVDNLFDFGHIAVTNAIGDIFVMGGKPITAITILSWPINKPSPEIAREVTEDGRHAYRQADIALAGGHSADASEPILGLMVTRIVLIERMKRNSTAQAGYELSLTKSPGIGVLTTTEKKSLLKPEHQGLATGAVRRIDITGVSFANVEGVKAMTDVIGLDLLGHLSEICQDAGVQARVDYEAIPKLSGVGKYIELDAVSGDTERNFASHGHLMGEMSHEVHNLLCDPRAFGDLLLAVTPEAGDEVKATVAEFGIELLVVGELTSARDGRATVEIR